MNIDRVLLSWPTLLSAPVAEQRAAPRSWIQLAKTGVFASQRYGHFSITKGDLAQMLSNFRSVTPKAPTKVPIDYDHLSMNPRKPGDGIAAGWLQDMELRAEGEELWGLAEWTPDAAMRIANKEYQFVSPSFIKNHTHKDGSNIGTTLLAAAITNHPFLEGMEALTLCSSAVISALAFTVKAHDRPTPTVEHLEPARPPKKTTQEEKIMSQQTDNEQRAAQFVNRVSKAFANTRDWAKAFNLAQREDPAGAEAYRLAALGEVETEPSNSVPVFALSAKPGETFDDLAIRFAREKGVSLRNAIREVSTLRPDLAATRD